MSRFYQAHAFARRSKTATLISLVHPFFRSPRRLVFAHRGGAGLAPENTLPAFDAGLAAQADGLELDVHLSRDGIVVVHHDRTMERTTGVRGSIGSFTADQLARLDAAYNFRRNGSWPSGGEGVGVPTLAAVLARYRDTRIIVEMKENSMALARAAVDVVRAADALDRVCFGAFGWRALRAARMLEPAIATSAARVEVRWALFRSRCRWPASASRYQCFQVPELSRAGTRVVSPRFVDDAHGAGVSVQVWTVDTVEDAKRLLGWRVDALITDRPDIIVPFVRGVDPDH
jgi:glycerophosphoryl diester phosphodiesterase